MNPCRPCFLLPGFALLATLTACSSNPAPTASPSPAVETVPAPAPIVFAQPVEVLGKISGDNLSGNDYGVKLLDVNTLQGTGLAQAFADQGVVLNPTSHSVVLLALGEQPAGANADITALQIKGDTLYVQAVASPPAGDSDETTRPFSAVAVPHIAPGTVVRSDIQ